MRGYTAKQRLQACLLGLTLLAGCRQVPCKQNAVLPPKAAPSIGPCAGYQPACVTPYASCPQRPVAVLTGLVPAPPVPVTPAVALVPAALAVQVVAPPAGAITPPLWISARLAPATACPEEIVTTHCDCGPAAPCTVCSLGEPCMSCAQCLPCPPCGCGLPLPPCGCSEPACAPLPTPPTSEPTRLPNVLPAPNVGYVLPAPGPAPRRRSFVDTTAALCFGHAPDYTWVSGQVEYSAVRKEWRIRYASVDETDRYGGRLALIQNEHVGYMADGQYVRVQGHLVNPGDAAGSPAFYRVEAFKVIDRPNTVAN